MGRVAISFKLGNSYSHVSGEVANSYARRMRGEEKRQVRLRNLRALSKTLKLVEIAERSGTSEKYLSQILNEVVQQRGKTPRALSDNYAAKIEAGLGLEPGWFDVPHDDSPQTRPEELTPTAPDISALLSIATPRSRSALEQIAQASREGRLSDDDLELLQQIAARLARKE